MLDLSGLSIPQLIQLSVMNDFIIGALLVLIAIFFIKMVIIAINEGKISYPTVLIGTILAIAVVFVPVDKQINWHLKDKGEISKVERPQTHIRQIYLRRY